MMRWRRMTIVRQGLLILIRNMCRWRSIKRRATVSESSGKMFRLIILSQYGRETCPLVCKACVWWFWIVIIRYDNFRLSRRGMPRLPAMRAWHLMGGWDLMGFDRWSRIDTLSKSILVAGATVRRTRKLGVGTIRWYSR